MALKIKIPLKYKFLGVLLSIMFMGFSIFFYLAHRTFSEDKKLSVLNLSLNMLKAATSEMKLELKGRLDELQIFIPRVYNPQETKPGEIQDPYQGLSAALSEELLSVTFYRLVKAEEGKPTKEKTFEVFKQYKNSKLLNQRKWGENLPSAINKLHPIDLASFTSEEGMRLANRSIRVPLAQGSEDVPVITFVLTGTFMNDDSKETLVVVDYIQDFLREKLTSPEMNAELFLISNKGELVSHPQAQTLVDFAGVKYEHPVVEKLQVKQFARESFEISIKGEDYLANWGDTGFINIYIVSQIPKSNAFIALKLLYQQTLLTAIFILAIAMIFSILFASQLTSSIGKLRDAAQSIGQGNFDIQLDVRSNDEIGNVAESFQWMANRITELVRESAQKARMEEELETARLVQSTLLTPPTIPSNAVEIIPYYDAATECGGDFWDAILTGNKLTIVIGDATGHGAPAAIVTAVAKSCVSTLQGVFGQRALTPEQYLQILNHIIYSLCKGKLLMTMCITQIDLITGEILICNAGHESPFCLRKTPPVSAKKKKSAAEVFFSRGERLGFAPAAKYQSVKDKLQPGDTVLLYTDGISEAKNPEDKEWGERALKKVFSKDGVRPLNQMREEIVKAVKEHTSGAVQGDDITFVLFSWKGSQAVPVKKAA